MTIANQDRRRLDVAQTYSIALRSAERALVDWERVDRAIVARWSPMTLRWIQRQAESGDCFKPRR